MRTLDGFKKGVNLGGWLSQGPLDKEHLDTFITEKDIARIASWGLDHVRLPIDYDNFENEDGTDKEGGYAYIDSCIEWCRKYNLNMVLDLHKTYGYIFDDEAHLLEFFHEKPLQDRFYGIWRKLIDRYAKDADIMMFEPLNEVVSPTVVNEWNEISSKCIEIIRAKAPTAKILLGGVGYNAVTSIKLLPHHNDENIVYNFHCYEPMVFTHQSAYWVTGMPSDFHIEYPGDFNDYMEKSRQIEGCMHGAITESSLGLNSIGPDLFEKMFLDGIKAVEERDGFLYCGEYGVIDQAPLDGTLNWYKDIHSVFEKYGIGRAAWNYKEKDYGLEGEHYAPIIDELVKYM